MRFLPVPEPRRDQLISDGYLKIDEETGEEVSLKNHPTAEEWAKRLGLETSYEVPGPGAEIKSDKHLDKAIQTLLFPHELEGSLWNLSLKAQSAIEESGANILYMAFGFLEWYEDSSSDIGRLAPLFLVPVRLNRGRLNRETDTYEYELTYSGEDILPNLSLREKLKIDFGLALPDLYESTAPEQYFSAVSKLISGYDRWVVRRYITVALLNFSKLLMYLDMDPDRWPRDNKISNHPIVKGFLAGWVEENGKTSSSSSAIHEPDYTIDELQNIHYNYPLIFDADSSQHSAIIDAVNGRSLVVEGPPGTGKSQTITNLIASAMKHGKKVLFVAEKLAALEVVKHRLDRAGLGPFCLELHSHVTQKAVVFENISERLNLRSKLRNPNVIEAEIARYEELKDSLKQHVERINGKWKNTDNTISQIFMAATRYRRELNSSNPQHFHPHGYDGNNFDPVTQRRIKDSVLQYRDVYRAIVSQLKDTADLHGHPWYGVRNPDLQIFDEEIIIGNLERWQDAIRSLLSFRLNLAVEFGCGESEIPDTINGLEDLLADLKRLPHLSGNELLDVLPHLRNGDLDKLRAFLALYGEIRSGYEEIVRLIDDRIPEHLASIGKYSEGYGKITRLVRETLKLSEFYNAKRLLETLKENIYGIEEQLTGIISAVGERGSKQLNRTEAGLSELKTFIKVVALLPPNYFKYRDKHFDDEELEQIIPNIYRTVEELRALKSELSPLYRINDLPSAETFLDLKARLLSGGLFRWLSGDWRGARKELLKYSSVPKVKLQDMLALLDKAINYQNRIAVLEDYRNRYELLRKHLHGPDTDIELIQTLREWYRAVRVEYGTGFGSRADMAAVIHDLPDDMARKICSAADHGISDRLDKILSDLTSLKACFREDSFANSRDSVIAGPDSEIIKCISYLDEAIDDCRPLMADGETTLSDVSERIEKLESLSKKTSTWTDFGFDNAVLKERLDLSIDYNKHNSEALAAANNTLTFASYLSDKINSPLVKNAIYNSPSSGTLSSLNNTADLLGSKCESEHSARSSFCVETMLDLNEWMHGDESLAKLEERNSFALANRNSLRSWMGYVRQREQMSGIRFDSLLEHVEKGAIAVDDIEAAYNACVYDLLAREILREKPELARFSGLSQVAITEKFKDYDLRLQKLHGENIAWRIDQTPVPSGVNTGRVGDYTELSLLLHECGKQKRHIALRQLLKRAGNALACLKPCFMMGPMSVAQYLEPGQIIFDIVIMDEASQIKPEDAIGSIARGEQIIVVGDPKQLPPTSFFDRLVEDGANEDDDTMTIQLSESILETCMSSFPVRRLNWHYRSQHESLIAFSNSSFYDNGLVLFPSPHKDHDDYGIKYFKVPHGYFINRSNHEEAKAISQSLKKHLMEKPNESIGVVAMSAEQRDHIQRTINEMEKDDAVFASLLEANRSHHEHLFVKNLENVQGDERDVILISMTYGPMEPGGQVFQRFGPINQENGWRRLNVLFTRSRKRMHIFSSMSSTDILVGHNPSRGIKTLHDFLRFCETGIIHKTHYRGDKLPDSDFEIAVADALRREGFECDAQVGVAGFFIDVAVIDPGSPGRYLMGIECDGATYHSAKSVRDRDRLRREILEKLGWRIERVWSTDWFKDPDAILVPIIRELHKLKSQFDFESAHKLEEIIDQSEPVIEKYFAGSLGLKEKLLEFDNEVIRKACPRTPENARLLRPAMLEAFIDHKPINKQEFFEYIPAYLRLATSVDEGDYIDEVLEIINSSI